MTRTIGDFNREFEAEILRYGPWSPTCDRVERGKQLRSLATLAAVYLGSDHDIVEALRSAESDPMEFTRSQVLFELLPALTRRRMLSTFSVVSFRKPRT